MRSTHPADEPPAVDIVAATEALLEAERIIAAWQHDDISTLQAAYELFRSAARAVRAAGGQP
jgi:hypothetical protein